MKKLTAYLLVILGSLGLVLDLLSIWGVVEVELSYLRVGTTPSGLGILFLRFVVLAIIYIIGLVMGIRLFKNMAVATSRLEIFSLIILLIILVSFIWLRLDILYSLKVHSLLKTY